MRKIEAWETSDGLIKKEKTKALSHSIDKVCENAESVFHKNVKGGRFSRNDEFVILTALFGDVKSIISIRNTLDKYFHPDDDEFIFDED